MTFLSFPFSYLFLFSFHSITLTRVSTAVLNSRNNSHFFVSFGGNDSNILVFSVTQAVHFWWMPLFHSKHFFFYYYYFSLRNVVVAVIYFYDLHPECPVNRSIIMRCFGEQVAESEFCLPWITLLLIFPVLCFSTGKKEI